MLADIVVDTNVLMHADNPQEVRQPACNDLISEMRKCATHLCVDEGFDLNEPNNRSKIGSEYIKHLRFGMVGFELVRHLAVSHRVKEVSSKVAQNVGRKIATQGIKGTDRVFVKVAFNSLSKTLACHDFNDVPNTVRARLRQSVGISIVDAQAAFKALR